MKLDSRSAAAVGHVNLVFNKPEIPNVGSLSPRLMHRLIAGAAAAMLAFALGLLIAVFGALAADELARAQPTTERAGTDSVRVQPTAKEFAPPNQPDVGATAPIALSPAHRSAGGNPIGFSLEYPAFG